MNRRPTSTGRRTFAFETALGRGTVGYGPAGIFSVELPSQRAADPGPHAPSIRKVARQIARALTGARVSFAKVELDFEGVPPFHAKVYEALRSIPWGVTLSYGELAARAGRPGAARAAGSAMARSRWSILVPCHRVVASSGLGGFGGPTGLRLKRRLLDIEAQIEATPIAAAKSR